MNPAARRLLQKSRDAQDAEPVPSPCTSVCRMDPATGYCEGCFRTLDEIASWGGASEEWKRATWQRLAQRAAETE